MNRCVGSWLLTGQARPRLLGGGLVDIFGLCVCVCVRERERERERERSCCWPVDGFLPFYVGRCRCIKDCR